MRVTAGLPDSSGIVFFDAVSSIGGQCPPRGYWTSDKWPQIKVSSVFCTDKTTHIVPTQTPTSKCKESCVQNATCKRQNGAFKCVCNKGFIGKECLPIQVLPEGDQSTENESVCSDESVLEHFPIMGDGKWNCSKTKTKMKCKLECLNGLKRNSQVLCQSKKGVTQWKKKNNKDPVNCMRDESDSTGNDDTSNNDMCNRSKVERVFNEFMEKRKSSYRFDEDDFYVTETKRSLKALFKCQAKVLS